MSWTAPPNPARVPAGPPVRTPVSRPADVFALPAQLTPLIGREAEVASVVDLLSRHDVRLVTMTGAGGIGKTRIALAAAREISDSFADGVCFVPLAAVGDPDLVAPTIAQSLNLREIGDRSPTEGLRAFLRGRELLLLLDSFERVVAAAPVLTELLGACPGLKALVTSRATLHVLGEHDLPVPPLSLPSRENGLRSLDPRLLSHDSDAVSLFVERARAVRPDFALTTENAPAIAEICRRLDGLPLAIELAAARSKVLAPSALLARLTGVAAGSSLELLTGGPRDLPDRQRTMRGAIAWSHDLLTSDEQLLFRRLAVFAGRFTLEAAEWVTSEGSLEMGAGDLPLPTTGQPSPAVLDGISSLVDQSLVRREEGPGGDLWFWMLETVREFGLERLAASGEDAAVRDRHARWYQTLAEAAERSFLGGDDRDWSARLLAEQDNLRAALTWAIEREDGALAQRIGGALMWFWFFNRGRFAEGRGWLARCLEPAWGRRTPAAIRAKAVYAAGFLGHYQGDDVHAVPLLEESVALFREAGEREQVARGLLLLGIVAEDAGDYDRAAPLIEESLVIFREFGAKLWSANALFHLGIVAFGRRDYGRAMALGEAALAEYREIGDKLGISVGLSGTLTYMGLVAVATGDAPRARALLRDALERRAALGDAWGVSESLAGLGTLAAATRQAQRAVRLFGAAEAIRETIGTSLALPERAVYEEAITRARAGMSESAFAAAWVAGRSLTLEEAVAEARGDDGGGAVAAPQPAVATSASPGTARPQMPQNDAGLTPREQEVLRLLATGMSDREIGDALSISPRTAMRHVANIYAKLDVSSRAAATAYAIRQGWV